MVSLAWLVFSESIQITRESPFFSYFANQVILEFGQESTSNCQCGMLRVCLFLVVGRTMALGGRKISVGVMGY